MAIKVIGAGFGRNGTLSLKQALETLGFGKCYHMAEVFQHPEHVPVWRAAAHGKSVDWDAVFDGYQASVDWPSCSFWQEQMARYPDAKVVLSERDPERWYESVMNTIYPDPRPRLAGDLRRASRGQGPRDRRLQGPQQQGQGNRTSGQAAGPRALERLGASLPIPGMPSAAARLPAVELDGRIQGKGVREGGRVIRPCRSPGASRAG